MANSCYSASAPQFHLLEQIRGHDVCKQNRPHRTLGVKRDDEGQKYQAAECAVCNTETRVYMNEEGTDFQKNYETPANTDTSDSDDKDD